MIYVGIDVASEKHDFYIMNDAAKSFTQNSITITNSDDGYKKLHKAIKDFCEVQNDFKVRIGLESTGLYHYNILYFLLSNKFDVCLINPLLTNNYKKSRQIHNAKNDNIDAKNICNYLRDNNSIFKPYTLISYHNEDLKSLERTRYYLSIERGEIKLKIYTVLKKLFPEYLHEFSNYASESSIAVLKKYPSPTYISEAKDNDIKLLLHGACKTTPAKLKEIALNTIGLKNNHLSFELKIAINRYIEISKHIKEYDKEIETYIKKLAPNLLTVPGVGAVTAGMLLGEIGDINNFSSAEKLISFAGIDTIVYESGKYKLKDRNITKKGSKYLRTALYYIARASYLGDPVLKAFYEKKKNENKHYYVIIGHLQKKVVKIIYSVLKNNKPYEIKQN